LGTYKGPGTKGEVVEITSKTGVEGTHVVVQMETDYINLLEIEVFGEPLPDTEITPLDAKMSSIFNNAIAAYCIDGSTTNYKMCHTAGKETYPWVTLVIPRSIVRKIRITNRKDREEDRMKNMKIWVGKEFPSTTDVEYTGGALLGTYKGPGTKGEVVEITSKTGVEGTHVVVQMETDYINLLEIEVFGKPVPDTGSTSTITTTIMTTSTSTNKAITTTSTHTTTTVTLTTTTKTPARCIDTGCKKTEGVEAECVYLKNVNWSSISHVYNVSTPWKEGLCKGADLEGDCCKCLPRLPVGCVDVKDACKDSFGGLGVCKNFVKDDMSTIDFEQGSKKGLCNMDKSDCCECFSLKKIMTTKP